MYLSCLYKEDIQLIGGGEELLGDTVVQYWSRCSDNTITNRLLSKSVHCWCFAFGP